MRPDWVDALEVRYRRYAVRNLAAILIGGMAAVFAADMLAASLIPGGLIQYLSFSRALIMRGQVWRLVTFLFVPQSPGSLFTLFYLYLYWIIGSALSNRWGSFRFTLFVLCGALGAVASGFIMGATTNEYLYMSFFFAFAILFPDFQLMLFFVLPIKMKYLALVNAFFFLVRFVQTNGAGRIAMIAALANIALFFWRDLAGFVRQFRRRRSFRNNYRR